MQEQNPVDDYVKCKHVEGITGLKVFEVENILSTRKPGLFASLDRKIEDPMASRNKVGGLEVKFPSSEQGMSLEEACTDK